MTRCKRSADPSNVGENLEVTILLYLQYTELNAQECLKQKLFLSHPSIRKKLEIPRFLKTLSDFQYTL